MRKKEQMKYENVFFLQKKKEVFYLCNCIIFVHFLYIT